MPFTDPKAFNFTSLNKCWSHTSPINSLSQAANICFHVYMFHRHFHYSLLVCVYIGVKKVLASKECSVLEDKTMVIEEYYDFMEEEVDAHPPPPSNNLDEPPVCSAPVFNCHPVQHPLEDTKAEWLQGKLTRVE